MIKRGDIVQVTKEDHHAFPCIFKVYNVSSNHWLDCEIEIPGFAGSSLTIKLPMSCVEKIGEAVVI